MNFFKRKYILYFVLIFNNIRTIQCTSDRDEIESQPLFKLVMDNIHCEESDIHACEGRILNLNLDLVISFFKIYTFILKDDENSLYSCNILEELTKVLQEINENKIAMKENIVNFNLKYKHFLSLVKEPCGVNFDKILLMEFYTVINELVIDRNIQIEDESTNILKNIIDQKQVILTLLPIDTATTDDIEKEIEFYSNKIDEIVEKLKTSFNEKRIEDLKVNEEKVTGKIKIFDKLISAMKSVNADLDSIIYSSLKDKDYIVDELCYAAKKLHCSRNLIDYHSESLEKLNSEEFNRARQRLDNLLFICKDKIYIILKSDNEIKNIYFKRAICLMKNIIRNLDDSLKINEKLFKEDNNCVEIQGNLMENSYGIKELEDTLFTIHKMFENDKTVANDLTFLQNETGRIKNEALHFEDIINNFIHFKNSIFDTSFLKTCNIILLSKYSDKNLYIDSLEYYNIQLIILSYTMTKALYQFKEFSDNNAKIELIYHYTRFINLLKEEKYDTYEIKKVYLTLLKHILLLDDSKFEFERNTFLKISENSYYFCDIIKNEDDLKKQTQEIKKITVEINDFLHEKYHYDTIFVDSLYIYLNYIHENCKQKSEEVSKMGNIIDEADALIQKCNAKMLFFDKKSEKDTKIYNEIMPELKKTIDFFCIIKKNFNNIRGFHKFYDIDTFKQNAVIYTLDESTKIYYKLIKFDYNYNNRITDEELKELKKIISNFINKSAFNLKQSKLILECLLKNETLPFLDSKLLLRAIKDEETKNDECFNIISNSYNSIKKERLFYFINEVEKINEASENLLKIVFKEFKNKITVEEK